MNDRIATGVRVRPCHPSPWDVLRPDGVLPASHIEVADWRDATWWAEAWFAAETARFCATDAGIRAATCLVPIGGAA